MLNQKEAVNEVLSVYEEMENLKQQNEELFRAMNNNLLREERNREKIDTLTEKLAKYGHNILMMEFSRAWNVITASYPDGEGIDFTPRTFEKWIDEKLKRISIPDYMSKNDVISAMYNELFDLYQKEKEEAKEILLKEANAIADAERKSR